MFKAMRQFLGIDAAGDDELRREVRKARGDLANAVNNLSSQARVLERQDPFERFVRAMREPQIGSRTDH